MYGAPPGMPQTMPAPKRGRGPLLAIGLVVLLVILAGGGYVVGGFVYANGKINSATSTYNTVVDHQNKLTEFFNTWNKDVNANDDPSKATAAALTQEKTLFGQLVTQSQAAQPQISTDDDALAKADAGLRENSWLTALSKSSLDKESNQIGYARAALAIARTILADSIQYGTFWQALDQANIDGDALDKAITASDANAIVSALSQLKSDVSKAIGLDTAPGLPTDMDGYLKTLQSLANDVSNLLAAAQSGDQTAFDNALNAIDSDSAKLSGYDFSGMLTKAESFYSDLIDKYNAQVDLANKA